MKPGTRFILSVSAACLLASCATKNAADRGESPKWNGQLATAIGINDPFGVSVILSENSLPVDVAINNNSVTPLMIASSTGSGRVVEWLLEHGAKVDACTTLKDPSQYPEAANCTPLFMACAEGHTNVAKLLVDHGAQVNRPDSRGNTPLVIACARGHLDAVKFLVQRGANIHYRDPYGATPLLRAIQTDHADIAEYLIAQGADVNAAFGTGRDALTLASERGDAHLVQLLIEKGAHFDSTNAAAALFDAAAAGRTDVVSLLIHKGALFDLQDDEGWTPLLKAAAHGNADTVKALCDAGADPSKRNRFGRTALDYARGIPGTEGLTTVQQLTEAVDKGLFQQDELYYVLERSAAGSGPNYDRTIKALEDYEKRFHEKQESGGRK